MASFGILGTGGFGIALGVMLSRCGHQVSMWSPFEEEIKNLKENRENKKLLPGVLLEPEIGLSTDLSTLSQCDFALFAVPSAVIRQTAAKANTVLRSDAVAVCVSKGFEESTLKTMSQVLDEELSGRSSVILSGPSHAEEVARKVPTTVVAASFQREAAERIQDEMMNPSFRIYVNDDVLGVELGGALKNIIALAVGICDGFGLGDNAKAALMTRGLTEIARLGVAMGAKNETFAGLSGVGDLIVTCTSVHSRNHRAGVLIGQGLTAQQAVEQVGMTVEGYRAASVAHQLSKKYKVEMPIIDQVYQILFRNIAPSEALQALMGRPKRHESESVWPLSSH